MPHASVTDQVGEELSVAAPSAPASPSVAAAEPAHDTGVDALPAGEQQASDSETPLSTGDQQVPDSDQQAPTHEHPSDKQYVKIAVILGVLTAIEVFTYFESVHRMSDAAMYALLTVLMILKFIYVVAWFMHLKFDSPIFKHIFVTGILLALGVYLVMLTAFRIWT